MEQKRNFCQSCGMPMERAEDFGTERDGTKSSDYCAYCYQNGAFTGDFTLEDMIAFNLKFAAENPAAFGTMEKAEALMREWLPTLKRWKK